LNMGERESPQNELGILGVTTSAANLRGPLKQYRWLAMHFGQDTDLDYPSFEGALSAHVEQLTEAERIALLEQVSALVHELTRTIESERERLENYWFRQGAQWWPKDMTLVEGLRTVIEKLEQDPK